MTCFNCSMFAFSHSPAFLWWLLPLYFGPFVPPLFTFLHFLCVFMSACLPLHTCSESALLALPCSPSPSLPLHLSSPSWSSFPLLVWFVSSSSLAFFWSWQHFPCCSPVSSDCKLKLSIRSLFCWPSPDSLSEILENRGKCLSHFARVMTVFACFAWLAVWHPEMSVKWHIFWHFEICVCCRHDIYNYSVVNIFWLVFSQLDIMMDKMFSVG